MRQFESKFEAMKYVYGLGVLVQAVDDEQAHYETEERRYSAYKEAKKHLSMDNLEAAIIKTLLDDDNDDNRIKLADRETIDLMYGILLAERAKVYKIDRDEEHSMLLLDDKAYIMKHGEQYRRLANVLINKDERYTEN